MSVSYSRGLGHAGAGNESSDSDHRPKRRKFEYGMKSMTSADSSPSAAPMKSNFAAKMMAKMGYVAGQGLGAEGRGRLAPIETQLRPQGIGLGAVKEKTKQAKEEERREAGFRGVVLEDSEEEEKKRRARLKNDRLSGKAGSTTYSPARRKVKYRTTAEIEAQAEGLELPGVLRSIIDTTGPETKLLTSAAGLITSVNGMVAPETEETKIAKRARRDLEAFVDEWRSLAERNTYFDLQQAQFAKEIVDIEAEITELERMAVVVQMIQDVSIAGASDEEAWEPTISRLESIHTNVMGNTGQLSGAEAYLQDVAVAAIQPLFKSAMREWEPLKESSRMVEYLDRIKHLLHVEVTSNVTDITAYHDDAPSRKVKKSTTPYESLLNTLWLPRVRSAITDDWDPHDANTLVTFVQIWKPITPPYILSSLLSRLIPLRLSEAILAWRPDGSKKKSRTDSTQAPPHTYVFPWLPYLPSYHTSPTSSMGLVADFKRKLKSLLSSWSMTSAGVVPHLSSWQPILKGELLSLLTRHLLPRLVTHLADHFLVDPSDQDLSPLSQVLQWSPYLPSTTMAHLLVAELFPKWHQTLHIWLTSDPNYDEIREWFLWWKDQLPGEINAVPAIEAEWNKGLETIAMALDLGPEAVATNLPPPPAGPPQPQANDPTTQDVLHDSMTEKVEAAVSTFRDVVEDWCASCDLMMIPMREADPASGLPLFRITASASGRGGVVVYLKGDVVWARDGKGESRVFTPVEVNDALLARAEGK